MRIYADWPMRIQIRNTAQNQNLLSAVLWIGTILILIWIQISMLVPSRSGQRSGLALKQGRSSCGSFPEIYTCWKIRLYFSFSHIIATLQCLSFSSVSKCKNFKYFGQHIKIHQLGIDNNADLRISRIRIGMPWMPIPIWVRIRQMPNVFQCNEMSLFSPCSYCSLWFYTGQETIALNGNHFHLAMGFSPVKAAEERIFFDSFRSSFIKTSFFPMVLWKKNYKYRYR